jgi:hypothetical protein
VVRRRRISSRRRSRLEEPHKQLPELYNAAVVVLLQREIALSVSVLLVNKADYHFVIHRDDYVVTMRDYLLCVRR